MSKSIEYNDGWSLKEIVHQPVTFTKETLKKDTDDLNEALRKGYFISQWVRTETGIVYVLTKWSKKRQKKSESVEDAENKQQPSLFSLIGGAKDEPN